MIHNLQELISKVQNGVPQTLSVAAADDEAVLKAVWHAYQNRIIKTAYLIGDAQKIEKIAADIEMNLERFKIVDAKDKQEACKIAIQLVSSGKADLPMKGLVETAVILKELLNKEYGLRTGRLISHVALFEIAGYEKMFLLSDSAMTIAPDVEQKADIIRTASDMAHALGIVEPKVAVLCAIENVNPKMPATLDAAELTKMNEEGKITGCLVKGPFALDNAISKEAAEHKGIKHPVAGDADVLIVPDIEAGNILNKSMEYFAKGKKAGCIMGAKRPLVLVSRASSDECKMYSIALAVLAVQNMKKEERHV